MRSWILILCITCTSYFVLAQKQTYRDLLLLAGDEDGAEEMFDFFENTSNSEPLAIGYKGFSKATMAEYKFNPFTQYDYFKTGKKLLEQAIADDPQNGELAMLRFTLQVYCPGFLGYDENIEEDYPKMMADAEAAPSTETDFWVGVFAMLEDADKMTDAQNERIKKWKEARNK